MNKKELPSIVPKKRPGRIKRIVVRMILGTALLLCAAVLFIHTPYMRGRLLTYISGQLSRSSGISLSAGRLEYNLFQLKIALRDASLSDAGRPDQPPFLELDGISIKLRLSTLTSGVIRIKRIVLENPRLTILAAAEGRSNLPAFKTSGPVPDRGLFGLFIERFEAREFDLVLKDTAADTSLELPGLMVSGTGSSDGPLTLDINTRNPGVFRASDRVFKLNSIQSEFVLSNEGILLSRLDVDMDGLSLGVKGRVDNLTDPKLDIFFEGSLVAQTVFPDIALKNGLAGRILLSGHVKGAAAAPALSFEIGGKDLKAGFIGPVDLSTRGVWANGRLAVESLEAESSGARLSGEGSLDLSGSDNTRDIRLRWSGLDLGRFSPLLPEGLRIASTGAGRLEARWTQRNFNQAVAEGELDLFPMPASPGGTAVLGGKIRLSSDGNRRQITTEDLIFNGIRIEASLKKTPDRLDGSFSLSGESLTAAAASLTSLLPDSAWDFLVVNHIDGALRMDGFISGRANSPVLESSIDVRGKYGQEKDFLLEGRGTYAEGRIRLETGLIKLESGEMRMSGLLPLLPGEEMDLSLKGEQIDLGGLSEAFFPERRISGRLNLKGGVSGTTAFPALTAAGEIEKGGLSGFSWESLGFVLSFSKNEMRLESLTLSQGQGHAEAEGFYRPSDRRYAVKLNVDSWPISSFPLSALDAHLDGSLKAEVSGEGLVESPSFRALVDVTGLEANGRAFGKFSITADVLQKKVLLEGRGIGVRGDGLDIRVEGRIEPGLTGLEDVDARLKADLSHLVFLFPDYSAEGLFRAEFKGSLPPEPNRSSAVFSLSGGRFFAGSPEAELSDIQLQGTLEEGTILFKNLSFGFAGGAVNAKGRFPESSILDRGSENWDFSARWEAQARFMDVAPRLISPYFPGLSLPEMGGTIDLEIDLGGADFQMGSLAATSRWTLKDFSLQGIPLVSEKTLVAEIREGILTLSPFELSHRLFRISGQGKADLTEGGRLSFSAETLLDLSSLRLSEDNLLLGGTAAGGIRISGTTEAPVFQGGFDLKGINMQVRSPGLFLSRMNGAVRLEGEQIRIDNLSGELNGGRVAVSGRMNPLRAEEKSALTLSIDKMLLDFPEGLQSMLSAGIEIAGGSKDGYEVRGDVWIDGASFEDELSLKSPLVRSLLQSGSSLTPETKMEKEVPVRIKLGIRTREPIRVNNKTAEADIRSELNLEGPLAQPRLSGRAVVEEGGKITFAQNTFILEQGNLDFVNPDTIEPDLNIKAVTRVRDYDIRLDVLGPASTPQAALTSDPPLSEPDIISLLLTGRTLDSMSSSLLNTAGNQAITYLNNALMGRLEKAAMRGLGLDNVSVDTGLLSTEEDPSARITVGQHITRQIDLSLSQDLKDARNRTWILNYNPRRNINLQGMKRDSNAFSLALRHEVRFGGQKGADRVAWKKSSLVKAGNVIFSGDIKLPEPLLKKAVKIKRGTLFNFYDERRAADRLLDIFSRRGYLNTKILTQRETGGEGINLTFLITTGPRIELLYKGADVSRRTRKKVLDILKGGALAPGVLQKAARAIESDFMKKKYYRAEVEIIPQLSGRETAFLSVEVKSGPRFHSLDVRFQGHSRFSEGELRKMLRRGFPLWQTFLFPRKSVSYLKNALGGRGYLDAELSAPEFSFFEEEGRAEILFLLQEGNRRVIKGIEVQGNTFFDNRTVLAAAGLQQGSVFTEQKMTEAAAKIRSLYGRDGFQDISVRINTEISAMSEVFLNISVFENERFIVQGIRLHGNRQTREKFLKNRLDLRVGESLSYRKINISRKSLYDLGLFSRVDIEFSPQTGVDGETAASDSSKPGPPARPCIVDVTVQEIQPYRLRYGLLYDTEAGAGGKAEIIRRNAWGKGILLGAAGRLNEEERGARLFLRTPTLFGKKISSEFYSFWEKNRKPTFEERRIGLALQQQWPLTKSNILSANLSLENDLNTPIPEQAAGAPSPGVTLGLLSLSFSRDTRDNLLDAKMGTLFSQNVEFSPGLFSSRSMYVRVFSQLYLYRKISENLVYASGLRVGIGSGLTGDPLAGKRFFAGGGTSVRGFGRFELGPKFEDTGLAKGGEGLVIINQELRFPFYKSIGGAVFLDLGNIYERLKDFNPLQIRSSAGFGLRWNTPYFLLRFDWGFKLDRKPGESASSMFFSIGQAF